MKIAVTGGTGFIGNHLITHLLKEGHYVLVTGTNEEKAKAYEWFSKVKFVTLNINSTISEEKIMEIVSEPELRSAQEAMAYVKKLRSILRRSCSWFP